MPSTVSNEVNSKSPWLRDSERENARAEKYDAILRASIKLFGKNGYHATSFADIADYLGVTKPTIYHYFKNKETLLFACFHIGFDKIKECLADSRDETETGLQQLRSFLLRYAISASDPFVSCIAKASVSDLSNENQEHFQQIKRDIDAMIQRIIVIGIDDGSIYVEDVRIASFLAAGAINTIPIWFSENGPIDGQNVSKILVEFLMKGFSAKNR
ncbi:TetR/AcrR family transcriptional regulator [Sphingomonas bisphenolicum]